MRLVHIAGPTRAVRQALVVVSRGPTDGPRLFTDGPRMATRTLTRRRTHRKDTPDSNIWPLLIRRFSRALKGRASLHCLIQNFVTKSYHTMNSFCYKESSLAIYLGITNRRKNMKKLQSTLLILENLCKLFTFCIIALAAVKKLTLQRLPFLTSSINVTLTYLILSRTN